MRDWQAFVRERLALPDLAPERESRIVRELAAQLEDFYREALAGGATEADADRHACGQIRDWNRMAADLRRADHRHRRPPIERLTDELVEHSPPMKGVVPVLAYIATDLRYGVRQLLKTPGFSIVAVLTLAFGIGATTAVFSVVNGVLLKPLPYPGAESLVRVFEVVPQHGRFAVAPANFLDWRAENGVFERVAAYTENTDTIVGSEGPERIAMADVSWDIFELLRVQPALGRGFRSDEDFPGRNGVIVLSHGLWQRRFGGDPAVIGRTVTLGDTPATIVGVMPQHFSFPTEEVQFWRPMALEAADPPRGAHFLDVVGRLEPGVSVEAAGAAMQALAERLARRYPQTNADESVEVIRMHELIVGPIRPLLLTLFAAVGVVVLIACANVANLLLVRASVREKEIAVRAAMGASRGRIVLQMLAESLALAGLGGGLGVLLAYVSIVPLRTLSAGSVPRVADVAIDRYVLTFSVVMTLVTGLVFGLAPAWQACRSRLNEALKEGGRSLAMSGGHTLRRTLLVAEVALSIVLLVGATLLIRSFAKLTSVDPGFAPEKVLTFRVSLPEKSYPEAHNRIAFYDALLDRLRATPGVAQAGMVQQLPLRGGYYLSFSIQGRPPAAPGTEPSASHRVVTPGYLDAMGIPLIRGRRFDHRDTESSPLVALIDEAFASRYFPNEDPIGRGLRVGNGTEGFYAIVGVVGNVHYGGLADKPTPTMYVPFKQDVFGGMWLVARTAGDPAQWADAARQAVRAIDPMLPAFSILPLETVISESLAQRRFAMLLLGFFAAVALFLAAVGLYGVVAYTVSLRTQEIGVRMAVGAQPRDVLGMVLGDGMKLAVAGLVLGLAGALALSDLIASLLFNVTRFDVPSLAATTAILLSVAALACYVPARRAMEVDPLVALRRE